MLVSLVFYFGCLFVCIEMPLVPNAAIESLHRVQNAAALSDETGT